MPGSSGPPAGRRPTVTRRRRSRALLPTVIAVAVLLVLFGVFTNLYTDFLWFRSVDYTTVFRIELLSKGLLFLTFALVLGGAVAGNFVLAYRTRPAYAPMAPDQQNLERYRTSIEPFRRPIVIASALLLALIGGSSAAGQWRTFLLWWHAVGFGQNDPQFNADVAFYTFTLPWWRFVLGFVFTTLVLSLIAAAVTHYLYGGLRLQSRGDRTSPAARVHLSVLLGLFVLAKAVAYWLDRYLLAVKDDTVGGTPFTGLTYTDVKAVVTAKLILAVIAVICAALFFANVVRRVWLLPGIGVGLLLLCAVLIGNVYPAIVQYFQVRPSEKTRESDYIKRNIDATRASYGIANAEVTEYRATTEVSARQLSQDGQTIPGTRLLDPAVVSPAFRQLQQIRPFYGFPDSLDIDRYTIDGRLTDLVVAVRELDLRGQQQRNWINDHVVYTHGFGFTGALGNVRQSDGKPAFVVSNIPPTGKLGEFEPRIYFGETSPPYSIVGAPQGAPDQELDYPDDRAQGGQRNNTYRGKGGVPVGSFVNRTLYAVKFQEQNILLSNFVNSESRILYERSPRERVAKVAPWLTLDGDAYPAIVDGRILWIVDGYTTSSAYPYAHRTTLEEATSDTLATRTSAVAVQPAERVNYIRNAVKATVDAYDGNVNLYAWDEGDPVLRTWRAAFPGTVKDRSAISSSLLAHLRYPQDLFKVQRKVLAQYHVQSAPEFYSGQDFWQVPKDPTVPSAQRTDQPPYYLTVQMPGQRGPRFSLTTTYVPRGKDNLTAFAAVEAEPGEGYGKLRVLQVPRNTAIAGPGQAYSTFEANPTVSTQLSLLRRGGSDVVLGNLLTLPVGGGLLYVEPVYVKAASGPSSYPLLQKVIVSFGDRIGFDDTLQGALNSIFEGDAGAGTGTTQPPPATGGGRSPDLARALADAQTALRDSDTALRRGDFAAYGEAQRRLAAAIERALAAQRNAPTPAPGGTPGATSPAPATPVPARAPGTPAGQPTPPRE